MYILTYIRGKTQLKSSCWGIVRQDVY